MRDNPNPTIGNRFKEIRVEHGMKQEEFGAIFGVSKYAVCRWEKGQVSNVRRETIVKLADRFDINPLWIMGFDVPKRKSTPVQLELVGKIQERLQWLDEGQLRKVLRFMDEFL